MQRDGTKTTGKSSTDGSMVDRAMDEGMFVEDGSTGTSTSTGLRAARWGSSPCWQAGLASMGQRGCRSNSKWMAHLSLAPHTTISHYDCVHLPLCDGRSIHWWPSVGDLCTSILVTVNCTTRARSGLLGCTPAIPIPPPSRQFKVSPSTERKRPLVHRTYFRVVARP